MNEKLQSQLTRLLEWAERATTTTANWTAEQIPLYIQELLVYNFWVSLIWFILGVLFVGFSANRVYSVVWGKLSKDKWEEEKSVWSSSMTSSGVQGIVSICCAVVFGLWGSGLIIHNADWIKISTAPRVFIVEYLRAELKK